MCQRRGGGSSSSPLLLSFGLAVGEAAVGERREHQHDVRPVAGCWGPGGRGEGGMVMQMVCRTEQEEETLAGTLDHVGGQLGSCY